MEAEREQKELFEFEKPKRAFPKFGRIFPFPASSTGITLSLERIIFISIAMLMLMVVLYALGVERGKALGYAPKAATAVIVPVKAQTVEAGFKDKPYTIVVATFSNKNIAQTETDRLKRDGLDAFVSQSNSYFQVRIGFYASKEGSKTVLNRIKARYPIYKDAYFALR